MAQDYQDHSVVIKIIIKHTYMKSGNFDKLELIKLKYCYPANTTSPLPLPSQGVDKKTQKSTAHNVMQQKINANRNHNQKQIPQNPSQNKVASSKQQANAIGRFEKVNHKVKNKQNRQMQPCKEFQITFEPNSLRALNQVNIFVNRSTNEDRSKPSSQFYEKSYDLLNNYRRKVTTTFQHYTQPQYKSNLSHSKQTIQKNEDKQNKSPQQKHQLFQSIFNEVNKIKEQSQKERCESIAKMGLKIRHSLLQGIDISKIDLKAELSNIQKLQHKIQSVLGIHQR